MSTERKGMQTRGNVLPASHGDLCQPAGDARGDVDTGAFGFALDQQWFGAYQVPYRQADDGKKMAAAMAARGLNPGLRRAVAGLGSVVARSSAEGAAVDGGASVIVSQRL